MSCELRHIALDGTKFVSINVLDLGLIEGVFHLVPGPVPLVCSCSCTRGSEIAFCLLKLVYVVCERLCFLRV
jgi:hypothetical protein